MGLAGQAIDAISTGNTHTAWNYLNRATGLVDELIENTVEKDDDNT